MEEEEERRVPEPFRTIEDVADALVPTPKGDEEED